MFNTKIPLYGISILLALICNIIVSIILFRKYSFNKNEIIGVILYECSGIVIGAKLLSYIQNYKYYAEFDFFKVGLSSYGAVFGAIILIILFALQFKKSIKELLYIFMPSIPLMYSIGKLGCFIAGCCYGIEYNGPFSVIYNYSLSAPKNAPLFPIQLVESIFFIIIFIYMIRKHIKNEFDDKTLGISFILCGLSKFLLDFLRMSHKNIIISLNQYISLFFIIIGIIILIHNKRKSFTTK